MKLAAFLHPITSTFTSLSYANCAILSAFVPDGCHRFQMLIDYGDLCQGSVYKSI